MKVIILGTKGIPNKYGGFEAFAQEISCQLVHLGHWVAVFEPGIKNQASTLFCDVHRVPIAVPRFLPANIARIYYDIASLRAAIKIKPDAIIRCGHTASLFYSFTPKWFRSKILTNLDGLEWARPKWGAAAKLFLRLTERIAVKHSPLLVADSHAVANYIEQKYGRSPIFIPYGATIVQPEKVVPNEINRLGLEPHSYGLAIARLEPDNQIEEAITAFTKIKKKLVVVGSMRSAYGKRIAQKNKKNPWVLFLGPVYMPEKLIELRCYARVYYHGHSVGGTNPSLLDAMGCGCVIVAHGNQFNREVVEDTGYLFSTAGNLTETIHEAWSLPPDQRKLLGERAQLRAKQLYRWEWVVESYLNLIKQGQEV